MDIFVTILVSMLGVISLFLTMIIEYFEFLEKKEIIILSI